MACVFLYCRLVHEQNNQINSIVLLRAIAALGVCFVHIQMISGIKINFIIDYILNNGQQGVVVFFVISGFVLPYSLFKKEYQIRHFFKFILKRSIRVDPPYWFCIILLFLLMIVPISSLNFKSIFLHITYLIPFVKSAHWYSTIFWTLSVEFQFYIVLGLSYPLLSRLPALIVTLIIILVSVVCLKYDQDFISGSAYRFTFGYLAFLAYTKLIDKKFFWGILIAFSVYVIFAKSITSGLVPCFTVLFIMLYKSNSKVPVMNFLGKISYSLYLVHLPVSLVAAKLLSTFIYNSSVTFAICLLLSILVGYLFFILIEKPALKLSKSIKFH